MCEDVSIESWLIASMPRIMLIFLQESASEITACSVKKGGWEPCLKGRERDMASSACAGRCSYAQITQGAVPVG